MADLSAQRDSASGAEQGGLESEGGEFARDSSYIQARITADGRDGWPVEAGRYRLAVARARPWANRAIIVRRLMLEPVLSMAVAGPIQAMIDIPTGAVVTNDFGEMSLDLDTEWGGFYRGGAPDLYPENERVPPDQWLPRAAAPRYE